jgi:hypothetical protein
MTCKGKDSGSSRFVVVPEILPGNPASSGLNINLASLWGQDAFTTPNSTAVEYNNLKC